MPTPGLPDTAPGTPCPLTPRQLDVVRLAAEGLIKREIGERLHLSMDMVKHHMTEVMRRTGTTNTTSAVAAALRRGWIR